MLEEKPVGIAYPPWKADDTVALYFQASGVAEAAHGAGAATTFSYDLSGSDAQITVELGTDLTVWTCNDASSVDPVVSGTYTAISGSATIVVTPSGDATDWGEFPADAVLELSDVVQQDADSGATVTHPSFSISENIGWMPG